MPVPHTRATGITVGTTAERITQVSPAARAVHRTVLHAFVTTGTAPGRAALTRAAGDADLDRLLAELHERDVIRLDPSGAIRAAYPFAARPTAHVVDIDAGASVYAMCAIDALGMSAMLHRPVTIHSTEPGTGTPITVTVHNRRSRWSPDTAVVVVGATRTAADCYPPGGHAPAGTASAADVGCGVMNFFTRHDTAAGWLAAHPEVTGEVLSRTRALHLGANLFGHLLDP